jgi:hypothetical protein
MKIDYDLIRDILLKIEEFSDGSTNFPYAYIYKYFDYEKQIIEYHVKYLKDANFIEAQNGYFIDLTPIGRDYLENIRDNNIWNKVKEKMNTLPSTSISVAAELAKDVILKYFNLK